MTEVPYAYVSSLRRLDEEQHILDGIAAVSPLLDQRERHARFRKYIDGVIQNIDAIRTAWTPDHGAVSWQEYVEQIYARAWDAYDLGQRTTDICVTDMGPGALVYFKVHKA